MNGIECATRFLESYRVLAAHGDRLPPFQGTVQEAGADRKP